MISLEPDATPSPSTTRTMCISDALAAGHSLDEIMDAEGERLEWFFTTYPGPELTITYINPDVIINDSHDQD